MRSMLWRKEVEGTLLIMERSENNTLELLQPAKVSFEDLVKLR